MEGEDDDGTVETETPGDDDASDDSDSLTEKVFIDFCCWFRVNEIFSSLDSISFTMCKMDNYFLVLKSLKKIPGGDLKNIHPWYLA